MNILIFENNDDDFNHLTSCIKNYFTKENIDYHIHRCKNKEELLKTIQQYNLLFLDIELEEKINGIFVGKKIRMDLRNEITQIVYVSALEEYAIQLFQNRPMDFLIKPIKQN